MNFIFFIADTAQLQAKTMEGMEAAHQANESQLVLLLGLLISVTIYHFLLKAMRSISR